MATMNKQSIATDEERNEKLKLLQDARADFEAGKISMDEAANILGDTAAWMNEKMGYEYRLLFGDKENDTDK